MSIPAVVEIEIWSDVICPWCWIGKRRLERALGHSPIFPQIRLRHRAFRLMPGLVPLPVIEVLQQRYGGSAAQILAMQARIEEIAAAEGLIYRLADTQGGDTLQAHRLLYLAHMQGLQDVLLERLCRAYFSQGEPVFDVETLVPLAIEVGLEREVVVALFAGQDFIAEIEDDQRRLQRYGASGVPFFLIGGHIAVNGAQPIEAFSHALAQLITDSPSEPASSLQ
ncbi:DsbA family oxidoreductase [Xylella taiwanensis]|nr:DsbA family oxidoreductase [Xylella taiwanensis]AXI83325.1 polyketide synthase [Xylella taiwanensis]MCD8456395.1 DsbA family oxidoreductase [Xylella taiwanensis]MCD8458803.1 DsbA family oxidoreductase [Xylella taiwanensis]MCD8460939.1 DsbA family oxidoreductase [Xylella taiwanensis]MCD8463002.1 DsbA family oxidoreductase [Xylella taiwanensis]